MSKEPSPDWTASDAIRHLKSLTSDKNRAGMARVGIKADQALGVSNAVLRPLGRAMKKNHERAAELWESGIREARLLSLFTDEPKKVTRKQAEAYVAEFDSWEIVDHGADLFCDAGLAKELVPVFVKDEREFVRRTAFAMMAWGAVHLKKEPDETFLGWLPIIETHSTDSRNFVKKAVNWALRQIGKHSLSLHAPALKLAQKLEASDDKTARWIGKGAVKELTDPKQLERLSAKKNTAR
ncbi:MAG TPA: DNA alkylation repair protein [Rhizobiaceae bacterium]|nr:DNA alkylation repair protein [Rhizobiaceae bacterium]